MSRTGRVLLPGLLAAGLTAVQAQDTTPPSPPAHLRAVEVSETAARLTWARATDDVGVAGYEIRTGWRASGSGLSQGRAALGTAHDRAGA